MTLRNLILATSGLLMAAAFSNANAATTHHPVKHHSSVHKAAMHHPAKGHAAMHSASRGHDAGDAAVDQLNAQSLAAARGGAAPAAPAAQPAAQ